ncbi:hypothetical protein, partial [Marinomonas sp. BSi20584]|uniref:hypothetical protein n=1 Tax=Marinomonas sp. BSi20584 TaxID=1594462 RepID=UPI000CAC26C0
MRNETGANELNGIVSTTKQLSLLGEESYSFRAFMGINDVNSTFFGMAGRRPILIPLQHTMMMLTSECLWQIEERWGGESTPHPLRTSVSTFVV